MFKVIVPEVEGNRAAACPNAVKIGFPAIAVESNGAGVDSNGHAVAFCAAAVAPNGVIAESNGVAVESSAAAAGGKFGAVGWLNHRFPSLITSCSCNRN